ncbi:MAG: methyltransferase [Euryarchaeota archaeon]|nr:methyltransferase [Euryarchaeota archaeon]
MRVDKKRLEMMLQRCSGFAEPEIELEQYTTPAPLAAELLVLAHLKGDIAERVVFDLGCGTGRLGIGAALLGARRVVCVDRSANALEIARRNAEKFALDNIEFILADVRDLSGRAETVVQNPPFGVHVRGADRVFLRKALEIAPVVYSIHKRETREFVHSYVRALGGRVEEVVERRFELPRSYPFHRKDRKFIQVDIYRIRRL